MLASGRTAEEAFKRARKKRTATVIITQLPEDDEIPNDDVIAAIREGEVEFRRGKLPSYSTVGDFMASLE